MLTRWLLTLTTNTIGQRRNPRRSHRRRQRLAFRFETLEARRTLSHSDTTVIAPRLTIYVNGVEQAIPANVGVAGTGSNVTYANPHTVDTTGILIEDETLQGQTPTVSSLPAPAGIGTSVRNDTIGDFFDVWRTQAGTIGNNANATFDSTHLLGNTVDSTHTLNMYVNGVLNTQFENYVPEQGDDVVIDFEPIAATNTPTFAPVPTTQVDDTSPVMIPLAGSDPQGQPLTYTVSVANPALLQASMEPTTNENLKISTNQGDMVFSLFDNLAPSVTSHMESLVNSGFFNNSPTTPAQFYRIVDNFMIQGGPDTGKSPLGKIDDQYNLNLQFNRRGVLGMAKSTNDTSDSEFFVTDQAAQFLDFNYSVWGVLLEGDNVRQAISNSPVHAVVSGGEVSDPNSPITINSMSLFHSTQDGVLQLKGLANSGATDVTVTATDSSGHVHSQTFHVFLHAEIANGGPFLNVIAPVKTTVGTPATFTLTSQDQEGDAVNYLGVSTGTTVSTVNVGTTSGVVTVTPPTGFIGVAQVTVSVTNAPGTPNDSTSKFDSQLVNVSVAPLAPTSVALLAASDTGISSSDQITNLTNGLQFTVNGVLSGATVKLLDGTTVIGSATASGTSVSITTNVALSEAVHSIVAIQTVNSVDSPVSPTLSVTVRTTPPTFTSTPPTTASSGTPLSYRAVATSTLAIHYSLSNSAPTGVAIDPTTGSLTWTPALNQAGPQSIGIVATDAAGNAATQTASINVTGVLATPASLSLLAASDTGTSNSDQITNLTTGLQFSVTGVTSGATVNVLDGTNVVGTGVATGTSVTVTTTVPLNAGVHTLHATQTLATTTSGASPTFSVTIITDLPQFTSATLATVYAGSPLTFPVHATAGTAITYSLTSSPAGATIDSASGMLSWTSSANQTGLQAFHVVATDVAGNATAQALFVNVLPLIARSFPSHFHNFYSIRPVIFNDLPSSANVGTPLIFQAAAESYFGLQCSLSNNAPAGTTIDPNTGIIAWTPTANQLGPQTLQITATNKFGIARTRTLVINVT